MPLNKLRKRRGLQGFSYRYNDHMLLREQKVPLIIPIEESCYNKFMSRRFLILLGMTVGSFIGGYIPVLWGADLLSMTSVFFNAIGGLIGIWITYKLTQGF